MKPNLEHGYQPRHHRPQHALRREPGRALAAETTAPLLKRHVEPTPPPDDVVALVWEALKGWKP